MRKSFIFRLFPVIFGIIFLGIISYWCFVGYLAYKVVNNPKETAKELGSMVKAFGDGLNDTTKTNQ